LKKIILDVVPYIAKQILTRRFRWCLTAVDEPALSSTENFATKREAVQAGQIALLRAIARGSVRPMTGTRLRDPTQLNTDIRGSAQADSTNAPLN
jgi:hypothetical protein